MSKFTDEKGKFESLYGVTVDFEELERERLKLKHLNKYLLEKKEKNPDRELYKIGLRHLLRAYIDPRLKISSDFLYSDEPLHHAPTVELNKQ